MFFDEILKIGDFIFESFLHIWPYLVVTIPSGGGGSDVRGHRSTSNAPFRPNR